MINQKFNKKDNTWELTVCSNNLINTLLYFNKFDQLTDLVAIDNKSNGLDLIYLLLSTQHNTRLKVRVNLIKGQAIETSSTIFPRANWIEREIWDIFGIQFKNHPDLRRLFNDYGFKGHPLLKDANL